MNVATLPATLAGMSEEEWQIRCDLAALYRLVAHHRWTDFVYTHLSARLPGPDHHFLINKYGVLFHEMRASDLVKIDLHGNVVEEGDTTSRRVNAAGFTIHSAIHMARPDLMCVVHTHTQAGIAVSAMREGLLPLSQHALKFYGRIAYHGYEGIALDLDERDRLVQRSRSRTQGDDPAQPRPAGGRLVDPRGVPHDLHAGTRLRRPDRRTVLWTRDCPAAGGGLPHTSAQFHGRRMTSIMAGCGRRRCA